MAARNPYRRADARSRAARALGFPARSVFKLEEIDKRLRLLRSGQRVIDLGAAPGSWSMFVSQRIGPKGKLLSIDLTAIDRPLGPNVTFVQGDALDLNNDTLGMFAPYDVVLSDMAPATSGNRQRDHARSAQLVMRTLQVAEMFGAPGSSFVAKLFMGEEFDAVRQAVRNAYARVKVVRPEGTRRRSVELFLVGLQKK